MTNATITEEAIQKMVAAEIARASEKKNDAIREAQKFYLPIIFAAILGASGLCFSFLFGEIKDLRTDIKELNAQFVALDKKVDTGFAEVNKKVDVGFAEMKTLILQKK